MPSLLAMAASVLELLLERVADERQRLDRSLLMLAQGMPEHAADLRHAAHAVDLVHQSRELLAARQPFRGASIPGLGR